MPPLKTFSPRTGVTLAYHYTPGKDSSLPGVVYLGGYMSDMTGTKATYLEEKCRERGQAFVRFDYSGHGASDGKFVDGTIGSWTEDALAVLDNLTEGPQIIVGSSMGGWIALLVALARADRICAVVGLAAAPDFSEDIYNHEFSEEERRHLQLNGLLYRENTYGPPYPVTLNLYNEAKKHLLLSGTIGIRVPVRLIQGKKDPDVPWQKAERIRDCLMTKDKQIIYIENGDHRLSNPGDLILIDDTIRDLSHTEQKKYAAGK